MGPKGAPEGANHHGMVAFFGAPVAHQGSQRGPKGGSKGPHWDLLGASWGLGGTMRCPGHLGSHPQEGSRRSRSCDQEVPRRPQKAPRRFKGCPRTPQGDQTPPGPPPGELPGVPRRPSNAKRIGFGAGGPGRPGSRSNSPEANGDFDVVVLSCLVSASAPNVPRAHKALRMNVLPVPSSSWLLCSSLVYPIPYALLHPAKAKVCGG